MASSPPEAPGVAALRIEERVSSVIQIVIMIGGMALLFIAELLGFLFAVRKLVAMRAP